MIYILNTEKLSLVGRAGFDLVISYATYHMFVATAPEIKREAAIKQEVIEINDEVCTCRI